MRWCVWHIVCSAVPREEETASEDFMRQLRHFAAAFRLAEESQLAFVRAHLGS